MYSSGNEATPSWVTLLNLNVVSVPELSNKIIDSDTLKRLTGGDAISFRVLYSNQVTTFTNKTTLIVTSNNLPKLSQYDDAVHRRVKIIDFNNIIVLNNLFFLNNYYDDEQFPQFSRFIS